MISGATPIQFPIDGQLDQSFDESTGAPPGTVVDLVNLRRDKLGRLVKREGYGRLAHCDDQGGTVRLITRNGGVAAIDVGSCAVYSETEDAWGVVSPAPVWGLDGSRHIAGDSTSSKAYPGCASGGGYTFHVWIDSGILKLLITDEESGNAVRPEQDIEPSTPFTLARVLSDGTDVWLVTATASHVRTWCYSVSDIIDGTATFSSFDDVSESIGGTNEQFDCDLIGTGQIYVAYTTAGGADYRIYDDNLNTDGSGTITVDDIRALAVCVHGTNIWVGYTLNSALTASVVRVYSLSGVFVDSEAGPSSDTNQIAAIGFAGLNTSTKVLMFVSEPDTDPDARPWGRIVRCVCTLSGSTITKGDDIETLGVIMSSFPFSDGTDAYCWVDVGIPQSSYAPYRCVVLAKFSEDGEADFGFGTHFATPQLRCNGARAFWGMYTYTGLTGVPLIAVSPQKAHLSSINTGQRVWNSTSVSRLGTANTATSVGVTELRFTLASPNRNAFGAHVEAGNLAVLTGGAQPHALDGQRVTELGFCHPPPRPVWSYAPTGGSVAAGAYQYAFTYDYVDSAGNRHQSAPFVMEEVVELASGTTNSVEMPLYPCRLTSKQSVPYDIHGALTITIWRTKDGPGSIFYRVGATLNNPIDPNTITYTDTSSDESIEENEILYTSLGELDNEMPPPLRHAVVFNNRIAGIDAESEDRIVFSKPMRIGRGPEFSSALEHYVRGIGRLTALAEIDGTLYAFSRSAVAVAAYGDGQDASGTGAWPQPQVVSRAAGATDPRSVLVTQDGILFACRDAGRLRIWLMPRGSSNPVEVGRKVRRYLDGSRMNTIDAISFTSAAAPHVVAMVNNAARGRATVWIRASADWNGAETFGLEYDYTNKTEDGIGAWNVVVGKPDMLAVSSAAVVGDRVFLGVEAAHASYGARYYASEDGLYKDEGHAPSSDADEDIHWRIQLADLKPSQTPMFKVNSITTTFEEHGVETVTQSASQDAGQTSASNVWAYASVSAGRISQRHWRPALKRSNSGTGLRLAWTSYVADETSTNSAGVIPRAVVVEMLPMGDVYRPMASERA